MSIATWIASFFSGGPPPSGQTWDAGVTWDGGTFWI